MRSGRSGKSGGLRVRSKVTALIVSLAALWAFAAYVTVREGTNLLALNTLANKVGLTGEALTAALQEERRASLLYIPAPTDANKQALDAARLNTDTVVADFDAGVHDSGVNLVASDHLKQLIADVLDRVARLNATRQAVDHHSIIRDDAFSAYSTTVEGLFLVNSALVAIDDDTLAAQGRALVTVERGLELVHQEDAMLAGVLAAGGINGTEHARFVELVGAQRFLFDEAITEFPNDLGAPLRELTQGAAFARLRATENQIATYPGRGLPPELTAEDWEAGTHDVITQVRQYILDTNAEGLKMAVPVAAGVLVRLILAGVLGLVAVIASIVVSVTTARQLVRQLERLRNAARDLASYRLPRVVERLQHGEQVDVQQEAPPLEFGRDEIGQVGEAFNQVQETAIRVAVEQAELRRSIRDVFLSLARRSQALLHRQLGLLDAMERRSTDSEELAELFRIDHLATRMRRNAENLIVLSGATAGRAWRKPVPMVDVLRGALAEVEDYTRVTVLPVGNASLLGRAVGDVIHLLAELIENAVSFSPPQTTVRVGGSVVGYGFAIEIEDRGLGMSAEEIAAANEQLRDPPEFRLSSTARLGLYVVGKLAERHGIRVRLTDSPYGGTTAVVLLPGAIMAEGDLDDPLDPTTLDSYRPAQLAGVGRHRLQHEPDVPAAVGATPPAALPAAPLPTAPLPAALATTGGLANGSANGHAPQAALAVAPVSPATAPAPPPVSPPAPAPTAVPETPAVTSSGLPLRQRRGGAEEQPTVSIGVAGRVGSGSATADAPAAPRDPDATRSMMSSYRSGTLRGRTDAARLGGPASEPPTEPTVPVAVDSDYPQWNVSTGERPTWTPSTPDAAWTPSTPDAQWTPSTDDDHTTQEGG